MSPFLIPLAVFAMIVLIVAVANVVSLRQKEIEVHKALSVTEMEHQLKIQELELELARVKKGS